MIKQTGTIDAIVAINPDAQVTVHTPAEGVETIDWGDTTEISQSDIDAKKVELAVDLIRKWSSYIKNEDPNRRSYI